MRNRKLQSYIYNGWLIKDAIEDAVKNDDVILRYEKKWKNPNSLLDDEIIEVPYLIGFGNNRAYKVKLTKEEARYYLELNAKRKMKRQTILKMKKEV